MATAGPEVYCTLLMSDAYLPGAMVLAHSLRDNGTKKQLAVLVTLDNLQASTIEELKSVYDQIIPVNRIVNRAPHNLYFMNRPDLASTFTKIALWRQTQFSRLIYIDADVVALRAPDELFHDPPNFAAVPDIGWPDCFNSGVLSLKPNMGDYYALLALAERAISFDGADQGLLNMHFRDWERLSFTYNCTPSGNYQYVPAYRHFQSSISMIHYIGHDKPWVIGRDQSSATGVYEELLGRWWAVYDKHFRTSGTAYPDNQGPKLFRTVQQHVKGEAIGIEDGYFSVGQFADRSEKPEASVQTTEPSLTDKTDLAEDLHKGEVQPIRTAEQRRYSVNWDPLHQAPPSNSRPEAANFPNQNYNMSSDTKLFQPPKTPEPPKGMHYEVPRTPPASERPRPIFPWESNAPKPTRVFADDLPPAPLEPTPSITTDNDTQTETESPTTPTATLTSPEPFATYQRSNAWDEIPEIERYISKLPQNRRSKVQVSSENTPLLTSTAQQPAPPTIGPLTSPPLSTPQPRRPSMKLTDFPTEIERPSLPVTPAPVHRPSFWGAERDAQGDLPGAEGVPNQSEWNPVSKLEELQQRQSEVLAQGPSSPSPGRAIPEREAVGSASVPLGIPLAVPLDEVSEKVGEGAAPLKIANVEPPPGFQPLDFSGGAGSRTEDRGTREEVAPGEA